MQPTVYEEEHNEEDGPEEDPSDSSSMTESVQDPVKLSPEQEQVATALLRDVLETPNSKKKYKSVAEVIQDV